MHYLIERRIHTTPRVLVIALAIFASLLWSADARATPILSVDPSSTTVVTGEVFSLNILIEDVSDLYAYQFSVAYDPLIVNANSVTEGAFLATAGATFFFPGFIDNTAGLITFVANTLQTAVVGASGSGPLASIEFIAVGQGTSPISVFFDADPLIGDGLLDSNLSPIATGDPVAAAVTVVTPEPATLLLVGAGSAATFVRRARLRARRR